MLVALAIIAASVAYTNGANSNFKGVATLYGGGLIGYRAALVVGTVATLAGGSLAIVLATTLLERFSGNGLVPSNLVAAPVFLLSVAIGAAATVFVATCIGMPVSTTHAITGGLVGAGLVGGGWKLNIIALWHLFIVPLALSPIIGAVLMILLLGVQTMIGKRATYRLRTKAANGASPPLDVEGVLESPYATDRQTDAPNSRSAVNVMHVVSALAVSFARGFSDTPKIAALFTTSAIRDRRIAVLITCGAMALGGVLHARSVAITLSSKIAQMQRANSALANFATAMLVIGASAIGMPVSTTHVVVGCIGGIAIANGSINVTLARGIVASWIVTVPAAASLAGLVYWILRPMV